MNKRLKLIVGSLMIAVMMFGISAISMAQDYDIAVIIKATDSDFWQVVLQGAETAGKELANVRITTHGPTSEADIAEQVAILENVVTRRPDAIVISSTSSDATIPALEMAHGMGIKIILIDNLVYTDAYDSFLATDNANGGALAADMFLKFAKELGKPMEGKVGHVSAMAGVQVLSDRDQGFITRLAEIAPDYEVLTTRYVDNRIQEALATSEDILTSNPDLIGFFANNNHTGIGVARAIAESGLTGEIALVAYDADPEQVRALEDGTILSLIVQDPFGMGYYGVHDAVRALQGETLERYVDTGVVAVTKDNFYDDEVQFLMFPEKRAASILGQ